MDRVELFVTAKANYHLQSVYDLWKQALLYITTRNVHQYNAYGWQFGPTKITTQIPLLGIY